MRGIGTYVRREDDDAGECERQAPADSYLSIL